ncbi:MAG: hypothetical protein ACYDD0_04785, partial [Candidatus Dormibacteria bacterium]
HQPDDVGSGLNLAMRVLEAAGFTPSAATIPLWATSPAPTTPRTEAVPGILDARPTQRAFGPEPI